jgi:hypothetical protein
MLTNCWDNFIALGPVSFLGSRNNVFLNFIDYTGLREDDSNDKLGRMWKEVSVAYFKLLS